MTAPVTAPHLLDDVLTRVSGGRFAGYYRAALREAADAARVVTADLPTDHGTDRLLVGPLTALQTRLDRLCVRTLISAFQATCERDPATGYTDFDTQLRSPHVRADLHRQFPELARLERLTVDRWLDDLRTLLSAARDGAEPLAALGATGGIVDIDQGRGDTHAGGRAVALLTFDSGARIAVKPHPGGALGVLRALLDRLDPGREFFGPALAAGIVHGGHEWQLVVENTPLDQDADAPRWALRAGRLSALAHATGATDLHRENVVATGDGPVIVDTETLTSLPPAPPTGQGTAELLRHDLETSALRTMLHPARYLGAPVGLDLSAYGGELQVGQHSSSIPVLRVVDEGTDDIRFDLRPTVQEPEANVLRGPGGGAIDPRRLTAWLVRGYREGIALLRRHREVLEDVLRTVEVGEVRQVIRPTWVYDLFLQASTHPAYLTSAERRRTTLERLPARHPGLPAALSPAATAAEIAALLDLDIPLVHLLPSGRLRAAGTGDLGGAGAHDPAGALRWWWRTVLDRDPEGDARLLAIAWDTAHDDAYEVPPEDGRPAPVDAGHQHPLLSADGTRATWLTGVLVGDGLRLAPLPIAWCEGGGTLLARARAHPADLARPTDPVPAVVAGATWHDVPADPAAPEVVISPFTGATADAATLVELADAGLVLDARSRTRVATALGHTADSAARRLSAWRPGVPADYLGGLSGALHALHAYADHAPPVPEALIEAADRGDLDWTAFLREGDGVGLAHGTTGRLLGLASLSRLTGSAAAARAAADGLETVRRDRCHDPALRDRGGRVAWCRGHAGLVLGLLQVGDLLDLDRATVADLLDPHLAPLTHVEPDRRDLSLCHGTAGVVLALTLAGHHLDEPELTRAAHAHATAGQRLLHAGRARWGLGRAPSAEGFLMGRPGWDLVAHVLQHPDHAPRILGGRR